MARAWTGKDATALRRALRMTADSYAGLLRVAPRTVAAWAADPSIVPRAAIQRQLDDLLSQAPAGARARFAESAADALTPSQFLRVAVAVVTRGPDVLLVRRRDAETSGIAWQFPAGLIKPGDRPEAVAERETLGETGITCCVLSSIGARVHPVTGAHCSYFRCVYVAGEAANLDEHENAMVAWAPVADLESYVPRGLVFAPVLEILEGSLA